MSKAFGWFDGNISVFYDITVLNLSISVWTSISIGRFCRCTNVICNSVDGVAVWILEGGNEVVGLEGS